MKRITITLAAVGAMLFASPAFAGGKNGLGIGLGVVTGKGGLVGTLLGSKGRGKNGIAANISVSTGKKGVLGVLLGGGSKRHGRGHHGGW